MIRIRSAIPATLIIATLWSPAVLTQAAPESAAWRFRFQTILEDFGNDPSRRPHAPFGSGDPGSAFLYEPETEPRFDGDRRGSLSVTYDSLEPTARYFATFRGAFDQDDDFVFGAILTIRPEGFEPDPFGFHPIAFSLFNTVTTGDERTGDLDDFRADTYDTAEMSYFPNVSPLFGGPFLSADAFGEPIDADAFANFSFASVPFTLSPGVTYLVELEHDAQARTLTVNVSVVHPSGMAMPLAGGTATADLSTVTGFEVDSLAVSAYHDGFNIFSQSGRSLLATVDYDMLYCAPKIDGRLPRVLETVLAKLRGDGRILPREPDLR